MRKKNFHQSADSLIQGIDTIILKNRCSFSDEELDLLQEAKMFLLEFNKVNNGVKPDINTLVRVLEIISRVFLTLKDFSDAF